MLLNTHRTDIDVIIWSIIGLAALTYFGLMPTAIIFFLLNNLVINRNALDYEEGPISVFFEKVVMLGPFVLAFFYSFSCPVVFDDRFGVEKYYTQIRNYLGFDECWAATSIITFFVWW
jgi:hypothetical protein